MSELGLFDWLNALCAAAQLAYAVLAFTRGERSDVALPLGLLFLTMFGWNFATLAHHATGSAAWRDLDNVIAPLTAGFSFHFALNYVGQRRRGRPFIVVGHLAAGGLGALASTAFFSTWGVEFTTSLTFRVTFMALVVAVAIPALGLLVRHLLRCAPGLERLRSRVIVVAALIQTLFGTINLWLPSGIEVPPLAIQATFLSSTLLYVAAFHLRLLDRSPSLLSTAWTVALAAVFVIAYVAILLPLSTSRGALFVGGLLLVLGLAIVTARAFVETQRERAQLERLAFLGRLNNQMAHDIKNPLAALKGATDFLRVERDRGHSLDAHEEFLEVIAEQAGRLTRLTEKYRRFGRLELARELVDLNAVVETTLVALTVRAIHGLSIDKRFADDLPAIPVDRELLVVALENLLQNSLEAMPEGGRLVVRSEAESDGVRILIRDNGCGMNPRVLARCGEELFTTKPAGSGLGLAFSRRVVTAHEGHLEISSTEGEGTEVRLHLPRI